MRIWQFRYTQYIAAKVAYYADVSEKQETWTGEHQDAETLWLCEGSRP